MRIETLQIPWIGPSMNVIWAGKHWSFRKKMADEAHLAVKVIARGMEMFANPVHLEFTPKHKGRHYDASNYAVTAKAIEDGLVLAGVLADDTPKHVLSVKLNVAERLKATSSYMLVKITEEGNG